MEDLYLGLILGTILGLVFGVFIMYNIQFITELHNKELKQYCSNKFYYYDGHMNDCIDNGYPMVNNTK